MLGIESSCDETGVALFDCATGRVVAESLHSQIALHAPYGGVVPELASRDHIRYGLRLTDQALRQAGVAGQDVQAIAYTQGPGLAGALLVGAQLAASLAFAWGKPVIPVHHMEGHLLSPLLSATPPAFPFVALLVSGGHTQLMHVAGVGDYALLGETVDDAAGEAFDKTAKLIGLPYPGGPALARLALSGTPGRFKLPRPMLHSKDFDFSFSGLKTAVLTTAGAEGFGETDKADLAAEFQAAAVEVLVAKSMAALRHTGLRQLVVAGGVGANLALRAALDEAAARRRAKVFYPEMELCTDNGAMIAFAGALRFMAGERGGEGGGKFAVRPRWSLMDIAAPRPPAV